jgi:hypothetical protein
MDEYSDMQQQEEADEETLNNSLDRMNRKHRAINEARAEAIQRLATHPDWQTVLGMFTEWHTEMQTQNSL